MSIEVKNQVLEAEFTSEEEKTDVVSGENKKTEEGLSSKWVGLCKKHRRKVIIGGLLLAGAVLLKHLRDSSKDDGDSDDYEPEDGVDEAEERRLLEKAYDTIMEECGEEIEE